MKGMLSRLGIYILLYFQNNQDLSYSQYNSKIVPYNINHLYRITLSGSCCTIGNINSYGNPPYPIPGKFI